MLPLHYHCPVMIQALCVHDERRGCLTHCIMHPETVIISCSQRPDNKLFLSSSSNRNLSLPIPDSSLHTNLILGTSNTVAAYCTLIPPLTASMALTVIPLDHCFLWKLLLVYSTSGTDNNRCFDPLRLCGGQAAYLYGMKTTVLVTFSISEGSNTIKEYTYRCPRTQNIKRSAGSRA